ncbi:MAG: hypothetical protein IPJ51_20870 [Saprospiraceae bacterium]|nr:hypothetical protein [Saprospiraceae bacterium]
MVLPKVTSAEDMPEIAEKEDRALKKKNNADLNEIIRSLVFEYTKEMVHNVRNRAVKYDLKVRGKLLIDLISNHLTNVTSP